MMGPSGCGKSTLLHLLGGLDRPSGGELWLADGGSTGSPSGGWPRLRRREVGFVFQAFHLMDELTAQENVELPALLAGRSPRLARRRAAELLDQVGLADRAEHLPSALSGGQRQRVAIARAFANEPQLVLADEPTGNLDSAATLEVLRLFEHLRTRRADAGDRHPRRADRRHRRPADLDARRRLRRRDPAGRGITGDLGDLFGVEGGRDARPPRWRCPGGGDLRRHLSERCDGGRHRRHDDHPNIGVGIARRDRSPLQDHPGATAGPDVAAMPTTHPTSGRSAAETRTGVRGDHLAALEGLVHAPGVAPQRPVPGELPDDAGERVQGDRRRRGPHDGTSVARPAVRHRRGLGAPRWGGGRDGASPTSSASRSATG